MACKNALKETSGDVDAAVDYLRQKGLAGADKKSGRITTEGLIVEYIHQGSGWGPSSPAPAAFIGKDNTCSSLHRCYPPDVNP